MFTSVRARPDVLRPRFVVMRTTPLDAREPYAENERGYAEHAGDDEKQTVSFEQRAPDRQAFHHHAGEAFGDLPDVGGRAVQRGHITRDIVFSQDGRRMFVSVGSATNDGEGMGKRDAAAIARWEAAHGLGSAWGRETDRAAVLVFDPDGRLWNLQAP